MVVKPSGAVCYRQYGCRGSNHEHKHGDCQRMFIKPTLATHVSGQSDYTLLVCFSPHGFSIFS